MLDAVFVKTYTAPPMDKREILRYAGCKGEADESTLALLDRCLLECEDVFSYRVCYRAYEKEEFFRVFDADKQMETRLEKATKVIVFAATVGLGIDRLVLKYASVAPSKAVILQAIGAERIEALCDAFCLDVGQNGAGARFSPGYGAFPLQTQEIIFKQLDCARNIGVTLNDSLLMVPTKSVTAVVGLE